MRIVLIGYGPVGARFVEELLPAVADGHVELTVIGAEPHDAYNRVLLADYATGRADRERLETTDTAAAEAAGVRFLLGSAVVGISRFEHVVRVVSERPAGTSAPSGDRAPVATADSASPTVTERIPYDRLVFATGARANIPTLDGLERSRRSRLGVAQTPGAVDRGDKPLPAGVVALRTLEDAEVVRAHIAENADAQLVVLGAGVLGMELALAAAEAGASVAVVYHDGVPMGRNLDQGSGRVLARLTGAVGVAMHPHARGEAVLFGDVSDGHPHFDGLLCADGTIVKGSLLVLSCGVAPRTELAAAAGLRVSAGIVVDEGLRSWTDDDVFAIGDCAQIVAPSSVGERELRDADARIPGAPSGLVGPGWRQASWLAARFADEALELPPAAPLDAERVPVVMLKAEGVDAVAAGDVSPDVWDELDAACHAHGRRVAVWADPLAGRYVKTVTVGDRLTAFVSVGMPRAGAELTLLFEQGAPLPADRSLLLRLDGADAPAGGSAAMGPESVVCTCNGVTAGRIGEAAAAGCSTLDEVGRATRAGTGCGGCRDRVQALLDAALATAQP